MASLPSLLARGYLRSRRIPRIPGVSLRFQHTPPASVQQRPLELISDGRPDLFPSTRVFPKPESSKKDLASSYDRTGPPRAERLQDTISPGLANALKPLGIPHPIINALSQEFPHIHQPTSAQAALLKSVLKDGDDVFMKEKTGRGKTFAMTLIALARALKIRAKRLKTASRNARQPPKSTSPSILVLLPHAALAGQVGEWISRLEAAMDGGLSGGGPLARVVMPGDKPSRSAEQAPEIIVSTPDALLTYLQLSPSCVNQQGPPSNPTASVLSRSLQLLMVDEIDAMLRPLPGRFKTFSSERERNRHPFYRHPPSIVRLLNDVLRLGERGSAQVQSVWSSATLNSVVRGFVQRSGWIRKEQQTIIDTTHESETLEQLPSPPSNTVHYCLTSDPITGQMQNLGASTEPDIADLVTLEPNDPSTAEKIHPLMIENLALLYASRLQVSTGHSLAIVPSGASMTSLQRSLSSLGISSSVLDGTPPPPPPTLLLIDRAHVRGLDLPSLTTVYLLNGLDVSSMSKSSRSAGGSEERKREYTHFAGRMDRLGGAGDGGKGYEMVNLVMRGSGEEKALQGMFVDRADLRVGHLEGEGIEV